jgi:hypothetical protein
MLSFDMRVKEAGLNENKLLNQDRLADVLEAVDAPELGPDNEGVKGVGSMLDRSALSVMFPI